MLTICWLETSGVSETVMLPGRGGETMSGERERLDGSKTLWSGRLASVLIVLFIVLVLVLMYFSVRGPR